MRKLINWLRFKFFGKTYQKLWETNESLIHTSRALEDALRTYYDSYMALRADSAVSIAGMVLQNGGTLVLSEATITAVQNVTVHWKRLENKDVEFTLVFPEEKQEGEAQ